VALPEENEKATKILESQDCYKNIKCVDTSVLDKSNVRVLIEACYFLGISEVFVSSWSSVKDRMFLYWSLRNAGITLRILCIELGAFYRKSEISMLGGVPSIKFSPPLITGSDFWVKRGFDFVVSVSLIILLSPLLIAIALIIKLDSPGPIVYKQQRVGLNDKRFKALKFRTMVINADKLQKELEARNETNDGVLFKMKNDPRITKVGVFLRRYSLDELPQLFNVLFGEMSLVGPRPLPVRDVEKFSEHHFIRHKVLPGITGLWQVSGRSDILDFEQVVRLDTFYIENWSLLLDVQILLRTVLVILQKKGAY
jgi:exopolysaccharide biosynthesis polyprenyl glycosylphosphotransferase